MCVQIIYVGRILTKKLHFGLASLQCKCHWWSFVDLHYAVSSTCMSDELSSNRLEEGAERGGRKEWRERERERERERGREGGGGERDRERERERRERERERERERGRERERE